VRDELRQHGKARSHAPEGVRHRGVIGHYSVREAMEKVISASAPSRMMA
jgi:hypothetical protein